MVPSGPSCVHGTAYAYQAAVVAVAGNGRKREQVLEKTVQVFPEAPWAATAMLNIVIQTIPDDIPAWSTRPEQRDLKLRQFWVTEPLLASAIYGVVARNSAFKWVLDGPPRTAQAAQEMLQTADLGNGWGSFIIKLATDVLTTDAGGFIEVIHDDPDDPRSPVIGIAHLDSGACQLSGMPDIPVIYRDDFGKLHKMNWWQVIHVTEMPSPIKVLRGLQFCAVSRCLRAAQIIREYSIYKHEKISGRFTRAIHMVSGVRKETIDDALKSAQAQNDNIGLMRYSQPIILSALDPTAQPAKVTIELASLPDGFDEDKQLRWYVTQVAAALGLDYQDIAPLSGGSLGSGRQSQVLHMKARGKGPALFMQMIQHVMNYRGILPRSVQFRYDEPDLMGQREAAVAANFRAKTRSLRVESGEITPQIARQIAQDEGDLRPEYLRMLGESDVTPHVVANSDLPLQDEHPVPPNVTPPPEVATWAPAPAHVAVPTPQTPRNVPTGGR